MAWRPYDNLIEGELDNTTLGNVTGWIAFYRNGKDPLTVTLELVGDFHEDIRGCKIRLTNPTPQDRSDVLEREDSYMDGFDERQIGQAGDITAGLKVNGAYPYTPYPYVEWYSEANGRVVLELDPGQLAVLQGQPIGLAPLSEAEQAQARFKREEAMMEFIRGLLNQARATTGKPPLGESVKSRPEAR